MCSPHAKINIGRQVLLAVNSLDHFIILKTLESYESKSILKFFSSLTEQSNLFSMIFSFLIFIAFSLSMRSDLRNICRSESETTTKNNKQTIKNRAPKNEMLRIFSSKCTKNMRAFWQILFLASKIDVTRVKTVNNETEFCHLIMTLYDVSLILPTQAVPLLLMQDLMRMENTERIASGHAMLLLIWAICSLISSWSHGCTRSYTLCPNKST